LDASKNLSFPLGRSDYPYHLENFFFGVKTRPENDSRPLPIGVVPITNCSCESSELTAAKSVSYIDFVEVSSKRLELNSCCAFS
jgi:hypothetical protein